LSTTTWRVTHVFFFKMGCIVTREVTLLWNKTMSIIIIDFFIEQNHFQ